MKLFSTNLLLLGLVMMSMVMVSEKSFARAEEDELEEECDEDYGDYDTCEGETGASRRSSVRYSYKNRVLEHTSGLTEVIAVTFWAKRCSK